MRCSNNNFFNFERLQVNTHQEMDGFYQDFANVNKSANLIVMLLSIVISFGFTKWRCVRRKEITIE